MVGRKVFKTKMCVLYQRGRCSRQGCSFAHGDAELRRFSASYSGKRKYQDGDLRDKLDRKLSPERRYSPGRDARDQWILRGHSPLRSIEKKRNRKKKQCLDGQGGLSENLKTSNEIKDLVIEGRTGSSTPKSILEDQLKELRSEVKMLVNHMQELNRLVDEKIQEAGSLTSQIEELESQLEKEKEECKRITSRIKNFVKAHNRCAHLEDELKRSQARLQKLGEQLALNISGTSGNEENSNIDIVSDGETTGCYVSHPQNELRTNSSPGKKRLHANQNIAEEPILNGKGRQAETTQTGKRSRWSERPTQSNIDKENGLMNHGKSSTVALASNEKLKRGTKVPISISTADKLKGAHAGFSLPSTSMAAHAVNDDELLEIEEEEKVEVSGLPFLLPLPPPILQNGYSQYEGNDQNVDIDELDEETVHVDIL